MNPFDQPQRLVPPWHLQSPPTPSLCSQYSTLFTIPTTHCDTSLAIQPTFLSIPHQVPSLPILSNLNTTINDNYSMLQPASDHRSELNVSIQPQNVPVEHAIDMLTAPDIAFRVPATDSEIMTTSTSPIIPISIPLSNVSKLSVNNVHTSVSSCSCLPCQSCHDSNISIPTLYCYGLPGNKPFLMWSTKPDASNDKCMIQSKELITYKHHTMWYSSETEQWTCPIEGCPGYRTGQSGWSNFQQRHLSACSKASQWLPRSLTDRSMSNSSRSVSSPSVSTTSSRSTNYTAAGSSVVSPSRLSSRSMYVQPNLLSMRPIHVDPIKGSRPHSRTDRNFVIHAMSNLCKVDSQAWLQLVFHIDRTSSIIGADSELIRIHKRHVNDKAKVEIVIPAVAIAKCILTSNSDPLHRTEEVLRQTTWNNLHQEMNIYIHLIDYCNRCQVPLRCRMLLYAQSATQGIVGTDSPLGMVSATLLYDTRYPPLIFKYYSHMMSELIPASTKSSTNVSCVTSLTNLSALEQLFCYCMEQQTMVPLRETRAVLFRHTIRTALESLAQFHQAGFVHRDIKPNNFWVEASYMNIRVLLGDFGRSIKLTDLKEGDRYQGGTAGYMAPEQYDEDSASGVGKNMLSGDQASDIWSLGVSLLCVYRRMHLTDLISHCQKDVQHVILSYYEASTTQVGTLSHRPNRCQMMLFANELQKLVMIDTSHRSTDRMEVELNESDRETSQYHTNASANHTISTMHSDRMEGDQILEIILRQMLSARPSDRGTAIELHRRVAAN